MNWALPKELILDQNDLDGPKPFGPIEGQGIGVMVRYQKGPKFYFQSQFLTSKII